MSNIVRLKKFVAFVASTALFTTGLLSLGVGSSASTASNPTVSFDGNTLAIAAPADEVTSRLSADSLGLSAGPLSKVASTNRDGYSFGGWSLERGGPAATGITTATTSDTFRILYAVWNTTLKYNTNGADSGFVQNAKTQDTYRFSQSLALPTVGTLAKAGYSFGGWMTSLVSQTRFTSYSAGSADAGDPTLYAAWIKTLSFNANGGSGLAPSPLVYVSDGPRLKLPSFSETTLRKPGFNLVGWSTSIDGVPVSNASSYVPLSAQTTLFAIWRIQGTEATSQIRFKPGKNALRTKQKLILDDLGAAIGQGTLVKVSLTSFRAEGTPASLGKKRNRAVVRYLRSIGIVATYSRSNNEGPGRSLTAKKNNRVTIKATWANPAS